MKNSQNGLPLPSADQEAGNNHEAALVRCLALLYGSGSTVCLMGCRIKAQWAYHSRKSMSAWAANFWAAVSFR